MLKHLTMINVKLTAGKKALPAKPGDATISFSFTGKSKEESYESKYLLKEQAFKHLNDVLKVLSPSPKETLVPGKLIRISLDDVRDIFNYQ